MKARRLAALTGIVVVLAAGSGPGRAFPAAAGRAAVTTLRITVWPAGRPGRHRSWSLRCDPVGGSLPRARRACRLLQARRHPFRAVAPGVACSEIYGGPALAAVAGRFRGRAVGALFKRTNGCEIARWNRVRFLFPGTR